MSQNLNKLKTLGAQKIHEDTHIALRYVQSVIHESFEGLTKVQFLGFISILEREYALDLSTLKQKGLEYFEDEGQSQGKVFVVPEKKSNFTSLYIVIVIVIFSLAIYENFDFKKENVEAKTLDNNVIVKAQKKIVENTKIAVVDKNKTDENLTNIIMENNSSVEANSSSALETNSSIESVKLVVQKEEPVPVKAVTIPEVKKDPVVVKPKVKAVKRVSSIIIKPRKRVWMGWINKTDKKKHEAVVRNILTLDGTKEWLIVTGHGYINIILNGKTKKYSTAKSVRYQYKNGVLKKLTTKEFKKLNNGRLW